MTLTKETTKLIRESVKSILANTDLSNYRINKIVRAHIDSPLSWYHPDVKDCVRNYYENIRSQNVFINFTNDLLARFGICYEKHIKRS